VASKDKLPALIDSLLSAVRAGELDHLFAGLKPVGTRKARRAA